MTVHGPTSNLTALGGPPAALPPAAGIDIAVPAGQPPLPAPKRAGKGLKKGKGQPPPPPPAGKLLAP